MNKKKKRCKASWAEVQSYIMRFVIHNCAESGSTAFATLSAASTAIRSNVLKMTKGLRLGAVGEVGEVA